MGSLALVWFKRDLRVTDHAPLVAAQAHSATLAVFIVEPAWLQSPECDSQHVEFTLECLAELRTALGERGLALHVCVGEAVSVLAELRQRFAFTHLLSHEETGPGWSYARDLAVGAWCRAHGVDWQESPQTGVVRRLKTRAGWAAKWAARMGAPQPALMSGFAGASHAEIADLPTLASLGLPPHQKTRQPAGEVAAWETLGSFLQGRGRGYRKSLSSPLTAREGCSRLSPHLAFGTISMRSVHHATEAVIASTDDRRLAQALRSFAGRLRWHCHFMQKLEDEPQIEFQNFARLYDGLRPGDSRGAAPSINEMDHEHFEAWCNGRTGYPMVDACMRSLRATGWLNFRMRAMLVSFASYHLWLHWRETGLFLARQFLDFEAGIHWSQMQMQSGTTGINTVRIYSPDKQALDHDPDGDFVRRWVPEFGSVAYPTPIVDEGAAIKFAKGRIYALRNTPQARSEADEVQRKHGSRKSGLAASDQKRRTTKLPLPQRDLFSE